jgi:hypothetical protein
VDPDRSKHCAYASFVVEYIPAVTRCQHLDHNVHAVSSSVQSWHAFGESTHSSCIGRTVLWYWAKTCSVRPALTVTSRSSLQTNVSRHPVVTNY